MSAEVFTGVNLPKLAKAWLDDDTTYARRAKVVRTDAFGVADEIRARVLARFPELVDPKCAGDDWEPEGIWFTGSNVWTAVYGEAAPVGADWDIIVTGEDADDARLAMVELKMVLGLDDCEQTPTNPRQREEGYPCSDGTRYMTERGQIDVWTSPHPTDVRAALRQYREASHGHCRVAFSLTDGLVALPNASYVKPTAVYPVLEDV